MSYLSHRAAWALLTAVCCTLVCAAPAVGQPPAESGVKFQVKSASERLEMTANSSRIVEFPFDVPRMLVNNPELVRVVPISPNTIQLSAVRAGVTQLNVWDMDGNVTSLDLIILGDVAELDMTLKSLFPEASLRLRPLNNSLYISGYVPKAEMVQSISRVAQDYFPKIINDMTVGGVHKILLHVKVIEVSRTKLRSLGFDFAQISSNWSIVQAVTGGIGPTTLPVGISNLALSDSVPPNVIFNASDFTGFIQALRQNDLAKLLAEPTLTTLDGRPAKFNVGGYIYIPVSTGPQGQLSAQRADFGTKIDFVPIVLGNGTIRLEVRPEISEIDPSLRDPSLGTPGFRSRTADTAVEMKAGQTLAIAGLVQHRVEATNRGIPILADLPWFGAPFRRVAERTNEIELLIFVTPEFCEALEPHEVPPCGPGQLTTSPTDCELYGRGYLEVPKNCHPPHGGPGPIGPGFEELPAGQTPPTPPAPPATARAGMPDSTRRSGAIGTGTTAQPVSTTRTTNGAGEYGSYYSSGQPPRPSGGLQSTLIGPLGYDDLK